jgi:hypothetical protein
VLIRREETADIPAVRKVVEEAFHRPAEARLVDQIRADGDAIVAAVAVGQGAVVGHVMFSKMTAPFRALGARASRRHVRLATERGREPAHPLGPVASRAGRMAGRFRSRRFPILTPLRL